MICVGYICDGCENRTGLKDGWDPTCKAFPDGIPTKHALYADRKTTPICNNGIGYKNSKEADK